MSICFIFPGQGSQFVGMCTDLFEKFPEILKIADKVLGYSLRELCLVDSQKRLNQTEFTQPALFAVSVLSYLDKMSSSDIKVDYLAGHSLGEYTALYAAGAFDFETGLKIVRKRGELMSRAPKGAMAAVLGMEQYEILKLLDDSEFNNVGLANINSNEQTVLSGDFDEIFAAEKLFTEAGARYITLKVSAGFHSSLMDHVAEEFDDYLKTFNLSPLKIPVISNLTGRPYPNDNYRHLLKGQINHVVKWYKSISWALQQGCDVIEEIGPGFVLHKMVQIIKETPMLINKDIESSESGKKANNVFMFAGQGSQYKNMGRELYATNSIFKKYLDQANKIVISKTGISLVDQLYHPRSDEKFDDVRITHSAILCFQYALAQMVMEAGVEPHAVLGHSLGEYVSAVIAGTLSLENAIDLLIKQAELFYNDTAKGLMMVVLGSSELYSLSSHLFENVYFASKNYHKAFVVSGEQSAIKHCAVMLESESISYQILPVNVAFHSSVIANVKQEFLDYASQFEFKMPKIPVHSCCTTTDMDLATPLHLWNAIAQPLDFIEVIKQLPTSDMMFIDMSPSGSLSLFLKYGIDNELNHTFLINQYGRDNLTTSEALKVMRQNQE